MKKYLIILLVIIILGTGVYFLDFFDVISLRTLGEKVILKTPFLEKYVETNESYQVLLNRTNRLEEENIILLSENEIMEESLEELIAQLEVQKREIEVLIQEVTDLRNNEISEEEKMNRLVKIYSEMEAQDAASIMSTLDKDLAVGILRNLKERETAAILINLSPEIAAEYTSALKED